VPAFGRFPSAQYLVIQNRHILIDCGEGAQIQMQRFQVPLNKIDYIFISHLHGDHYLGLMGLLFSMHLQKRTQKLHLYSPAGLDEIITLQLRLSKSILNYTIAYTCFDPEEQTVLFHDDAIQVTTIPLWHKLPCAGFLFEEKRKPFKIEKHKLPEGMLIQHIVRMKSGHDVFDEEGHLLYKYEDYTLPPQRSYRYAYCSDTAYYEQIVPQISGVDLLYHEATFMENESDKATDTLHSTVKQAAMIAQMAKPVKLLIGHFSARYRELEPLLLEALPHFPNTELAIEGTTFTLEE